MDHKLQAITSERDQLKAEFSSYRQSANEDANDLERINRDLKTQLAQTGQLLSQQIAATGFSGPVDFGACGAHDDDSAQARTARHYQQLARTIKSDSGPTGLQ
jgi:4-diphosphocytidyl-2C-methyl-D-erythritol kinase